MRLIVVNPNTSLATTEKMVSIATDAAPAGVTVQGCTARFGATLITTPALLITAAQAVQALAGELSDADAVIVAAFGDPGLDALRTTLACPVTGIAEAGMAEAGAEGRRFAVVTTTPDLADDIARTASRYGHVDFAGTWLTVGDPVETMRDPAGLVDALEAACWRAISEGGAKALVIGGGPLAMAARTLARMVPVPVIEPLPAAVRLSLTRLGAA